MADSSGTSPSPNNANASSSDKDNDIVILRRQIATLASCRPDVLPAKKRTALLPAVQALLQAFPESSTSVLADWQDLKCSSLYAYRRILPLYTTAIILQQDTTTSSSTSSTLTTEKLKRLLQVTCRLLQQAADPDLMEQCVAQLLTLVSTVSSLDNENNNNNKAVLVQTILADIAATKSVATIPACVLGAALEHATTNNKNNNSNSTNNSTDWLTHVVAYSLQVFSSQADLQLLTACTTSKATTLIGSISTLQFETLISPALLLKVKSHPDQALPTACGWISILTSTANTDIVDIPCTPDWLQVLIKHATGTKPENRVAASRVLQVWAGGSAGSSSSSNSNSSFATIATAVATAAAPLAPARVSLYQTLERIGQDATAAAAAVNNQEEESSKVDIATTIQTVLAGLMTLLEKDIKMEQRLPGLKAALQWIVLAKRNKAAADCSSAALTMLFATPMMQTKNTAVAVTMGLLVLSVHPDLLEAIVVDLFQCTGSAAKFVAGMEAWVQAATTKKTLQTEGLLAAYLCLLYVDQTNEPVPAAVSKVLSAGSTTRTDPSFVYSDSMMSAVSTDPVISSVLPRTIALYTRLTAKRNEAALTHVFIAKKSTAAARAVAASVIHPTSVQVTAQAGRRQTDHYASNAILAELETILTYAPQAAEGIVQALLAQVNDSALEFQVLVKEQNATRQARESDALVSVKGQGSENAAHRGFDANAVRRAACYMARHVRDLPTLTSVLVLMHAGSSLKSDGHQRAALILNTLNVIKEVVLPLDTDGSVGASLAKEVVQFATCIQRDADSAGTISTTLHEGALSLITSFGGLACNYSPGMDDPEDQDMKPYVFASTVCREELCLSLSDRMKSTLAKVEGLSEQDIRLFQSPLGTLFQAENEKSSDEKKASGKRRTEEEEWELEIQRELAAKKKKGSLGSASQELSSEQKKLVETQDQTRRETSDLLEGDFVRVLDSIRYLCMSDIEVGNDCLPRVSEVVLTAAVSRSPAFECLRGLKEKSFETLTTLATCVYEIDEMHAPTMAQALVISCTQPVKVLSVPGGPPKDESGVGLRVSALPSPCAPAACVVYEIDEFHDTLSGASFAFLFPVIRASLIGPRTPIGCEASLKLLERHTPLLAGDAVDSAVAVLRKDMAISVLELLKHDRAQTFQDPTPFDALVACYRTGSAASGPVLSTAELAPLLGERGALGNTSCRKAAMLALNSIASDHPKLIKNNPLIENRIWMNCFVKDENVREQARKTWRVVHGVPDSEDADKATLPKPSPLYAAPLIPLLSHDDESIAFAAADAYAYGMGLHPKSVGRNVEALCKSYIDSYPTEGDDVTKPPSAIPVAKLAPSIVPKKKTISTGLPKKRMTAKKSALSVAGIGKPKTTKKRVVQSALLKPKQERTLDQDALANQFLTTVSTKDPETDTPEKIAVRLGALRTMTAFPKSAVKVDMDESTLKLLTSFLMAYGIADPNDEVKGTARDTLRDVVASYGDSEEAIAFLLPHLETVLKSGVASETSLGSLPTEKVPRDVSASDRRKEGAVVALGSVALHLKGAENEAKIASTLDMLLSALKTPSESVQSSVADALAKLMKKGDTQSRIEAILAELLKDCLYGDTLAVRRGAAYGLSAAVKGSGIATLKKFEIVKQLEEACASGSPSSKEGSLFAIELLSTRLGLLFEPYVIVLLPSLLKSFSDSSDYVRTAASHTVGLIMSKLSAHGVKLVMPAVLTAFEDPAWRTKQASIHMLGAMSHLAPKQLASALPKVVPKLTEAFSDTHPKVKSSAEEALDEISTVIRNPEISSISTVLLKALTDPADNTVTALEALIATEFLHAIDAPSLALIVPILHRGLRDRGASTKRYGALIAGNICTMINDPRDFVPYLPTLLPDLKTSLLDPIPDVRSTSAKALGSLTRSLGDHILPDLRPWLIEALRNKACSSAERSGAAQGLTEVLIASGSEVVDDAMRNEILPLRSYPDPCTREGVLWVLTFLPPSLGQGFTPLLDVSLPALINGLSDDSEPVRDVAMRAGRVLIKSHGKVHVDKILPSLESALGEDDYRIRVASLTLLGDLLGTIGGTTVLKGDGGTQDDIRKAERAQAQIALALGSETRRRVLADLYLARNDTVHAVRMSAIQVWKTVVSVTVRTLRDILPVLVKKIIDDLASGHEEKTDVAGRCLGDIVSKLGDSVLPQIIPVLRNALFDGDEHTKRGVCVGLTDVIKCSTKDQILRFIEIIVKAIQDALCDDDEGVRKMAAMSFKSLHAVVGNRALDEVVPSLMVALESTERGEESRTRALNGLTGILSVRSRELLPYIIPRLIQKPITKLHAQALSGVAAVTGATIYSHFSTIIPSLLTTLADIEGEEEEDAEREESIRECSRSICRNVDEAGVNWLVSEIASKVGNDKAPMRMESCRMLAVAVTERADKQDFYEQIPIILRELLYRLNDENATVLKANHAALGALSKHVPAEELVKHIEFMRNLLASMVSDSRRRKGGVGDGEFLLPGFNIPKGLEPLLPIYQRGILYGNPTIREVSASGLGELISITSTKFLAGPLIIKMTGPLLRIVGDRNPPTVKIAILKTLGLILVKGGPALRAFVPQFQTTFVKALSDPSRQVRVEAIAALSLLMPLSTRVDPLIKELVSGSLGKSTTAEGVGVAAVQTATLEGLAAVLEKGGAKAKLPASVPSALEASKELLSAADDGIREGAAKVMGMSCSLLGAEVTVQVLKEAILAGADQDSSTVRHGKACAIRRVLATKVGSEVAAVLPDLKKMVLGYLKDDKSAVREAAAVALGAVIGRSADPAASFKSNESILLELMRDSKESIDMHRSVARGFCVALFMFDGDTRIDTMGLVLIDACLHIAMNGSQRVQFAFNDVLWLALDVSSGQEGLDRYSEKAVFDNVRSMKSLHSKVLTRTKEISILKD